MSPRRVLILPQLYMACEVKMKIDLPP